MKAILFLMLAFGFSFPMQDKSAEPPKPAPEASAQNIYARPWEYGEIKDCMTFAAKPGLLICDFYKLDWKESFLNLVLEYVGKGMSQEKADERAFGDAAARGKTFLVDFSDPPWPASPPAAKQIPWACSKSKSISCKLVKPKK